MKILHVTRSLAARSGGTSEAVRVLCLGLAEQGAMCEVVTLDPPDEALVPMACPVHALGRSARGYGYSAALTPWLRREAPRFDAVIVHGLWQFGNLGVWWELGRRQGTTGQRDDATGALPPYFVFPHGMLDPWFKHAHPMKHLKKCVYWWLVEHWVLRHAQAVLFTADEERMLARQSFFPYRCREEVTPLGISSPPGDAGAQREAFLSRWPQLRGKRMFLFLGRLHPKKGPELAIEGFAQALDLLPEAQRSEWALVMAGPVAGTDVDEGYGRMLEKLARDRLGGEGARQDVVMFTGALERDLKWGALHACEAFVLPSHQENFGIAVVEALACGKPVLISNRVNIWREVEQDRAALVESDSLDGAHSLMRRWMTLTEGDRESLGRNARRCFEQRFEIGKAALRLMEAVQKLKAES